MKVLTDYHHSSLLRSHYLLFERRLGHKVYRPIGLEWFEEGYWAINDNRDTASQFLGLHQLPKDNTPPLNDELESNPEEGVYWCGSDEEPNRACTLEYFKNNRFDIVIASIPAHIEPFKRLIAKYQPHAKLIVQIGNEWPLHLFKGHNVLASVKPREFGSDTNTMFYHQEFDTEIFKPKPFCDEARIYSFINILQGMRQGWEDFQMLERSIPSIKFASYGGQCRDGNINGPSALSNKIAESSLVFHVKDGGDGYGHILYNAYACGRPVITRRQFYNDKLGNELLVPGTFIDLDGSRAKAMLEIQAIFMRPGLLEDMGKRTAARFHEVVDFNKESEAIGEWLANLR